MRVMLNNVVHVGVPVIAGSAGTALGLAPIFWMNALILGAAGLLGRQRDAIASGTASHSSAVRSVPSGRKCLRGGANVPQEQSKREFESSPR
jgi:hypothetical protein